MMNPGMSGAGMPMPQGMGYEYMDERPRKSNVGPIVIIVLALLVLFGAAFGGIYVMLKDRAGQKANGGTPVDTAGTKVGTDTPKPPVVATPGALSIQVTPGDAKVAVDGKELSGASPFMTPVTPGKHQLKITHPSHLDFTTEVEVSETGLTVPPITLQPRAVQLSFELVPAEAKASLLAGGQVVGTGANGQTLPVLRNPALTYELQVTAPGYTTANQPFTFTGEPTQPVKVTLVKAGGDATTPVGPIAVKPDPPIKKSGGGKSGGGGGSSRPKEPAAKTATLKIGIKPGVPPAKVFVDGKAAGQTPVSSYPVAPGKHTVKFTWDGRPTVTETVNVSDGQTLKVLGG
jgi:hypothetical protein